MFPMQYLYGPELREISGVGRQVGQKCPQKLDIICVDGPSLIHDLNPMKKEKIQNS